MPAHGDLLGEDRTKILAAYVASLSKKLGPEISVNRPSMISEEYRGTRQWSRNKQAAFTVVWISFLTAAAGTMVFFAVFDPVELVHVFNADHEISARCRLCRRFFLFLAADPGRRAP